MAKNEKSQNPNGPSQPDRCPVESCKSGVKRMHFCEEHFHWYKEGLINKRGDKPSDFDKKFQNYRRKQAA